MAFHMAQNVKLLKNKSFALMMFAGTKVVCLFHDKTQSEKTFTWAYATIIFPSEANQERSVWNK